MLDSSMPSSSWKQERCRRFRKTYICSGTEALSNRGSRRSHHHRVAKRGVPFLQERERKVPSCRPESRRTWTRIRLTLCLAVPKSELLSGTLYPLLFPGLSSFLCKQLSSNSTRRRKAPLACLCQTLTGPWLSLVGCLAFRLCK